MVRRYLSPPGRPGNAFGHTYDRCVQAAAVVLAGGRSTRMGQSKASLEWHGSTLLRHVCGLVARGVDGPVLVVHAAGQQLPDLPRTVELLPDVEEGCGPLHGLAVALGALHGRADAAFACATDVPFLHPVFVRRVVRALEEAGPACDAALPVTHGFPQPLAAAYRPRLAAVASRLVDAGRLKLGLLLDGREVRRLDEADLRHDAGIATADPHFDSLVNVNGPDDYAAARARPAPEVTVQCFGLTGHDTRGGARPVRAATVATAAAAAGVTWDRHVLAAVNGDQTGHDGGPPLVAGDTVTFISAAAGG